MTPRLALLLELAKHHARGPQRPKPGTQPARFTYLTVQCADGQRVLTLDLTKAARDASTSGRPTGGADSDDYTE